MSPLPPLRDDSESSLDAPANTPVDDAEVGRLEESCPEAMEYVNRLIARMNTTAAPPLAADQKGATTPARPAASPTPPAARPNIVRPASSPSAEAGESFSFPVRAVPPPATASAGIGTSPRRSLRAAELSADLQRLREAANLTATSALQEYEVQNALRRAYSDLAIALSCIATSLVLVSLSQRPFSVAYGCAILTLVQAALATRRYFQATDVLTSEGQDIPTAGAPEA